MPPIGTRLSTSFWGFCGWAKRGAIIKNDAATPERIFLRIKLFALYFEKQIWMEETSLKSAERWIIKNQVILQNQRIPDTNWKRNDAHS